MMLLIAKGNVRRRKEWSQCFIEVVFPAIFVVSSFLSLDPSC